MLIWNLCRFPQDDPRPGKAQHTGGPEGGLRGGHLRAGTDGGERVRRADRVQPDRAALLVGHADWAVHSDQGPAQLGPQPEAGHLHQEGGALDRGGK